MRLQSWTRTAKHSTAPIYLINIFGTKSVPGSVPGTEDPTVNEAVMVPTHKSLDV